MKSLKIIWFIICTIIATMCLSGCLVRSFHPFYTEKAVVYNTIKFQNLMLLDENGKDKLIKPWKYHGTYMILEYGNGQTETINTTFFKVGKFIFLDAQANLNRNTMMFSSMHALETHCLYRVAFVKDKIQLLPLNTEWFIEAAKSKKISLPHVIRKYGSGEEILFTATSEEWMKFLEQNSDNASIYDPMKTQTLKGFN